MRTNATIRKAASERKCALALYGNAWRLVNDHFFDVGHLKNWQRMKHRFDKRIKTMSDAVKYTDRMLDSLGDPYTGLFVPEQLAYLRRIDASSFGGIGANLKILGHGLFFLVDITPGGAAERAGIKPNSMVLAVDGRAVSDIGPLDLTPMIRGRVGTVLKLTLLDGPEQKTFTLKREKIVRPTVISRVLDNGVGYLRLVNFSRERMIGEMEDALRGDLRKCKSLVVDLRGNVGGNALLAFKATSLFLRTGSLVTIKQRTSAGEAEIALSLTPTALVNTVTSGNRTYTIKRKRTALAVKRNVAVVVLTDGESASGAEIFSGALKDNGRAYVVGQRTYGKGVGQQAFKQEGGFVINVSAMSYRTAGGHAPGGGHKQRHGLKPDLSIRGKGRIFRSSFERDRQLQSACAIALAKAHTGLI